MSARRVRTFERARRASTASSSRLLIAALLIFTVINQRSGRAASVVTEALPYSLSYTVTGDYAIGSVDLLPAPHAGGFQVGTIRMSGVPKNAEILAAFLYWETLAETTAGLEGVLFRGTPVSFVR